MPMARVDSRCSSRAEPVAGKKVRAHRAGADRHWVVTGDTVVSQRPRLAQGDSPTARPALRSLPWSGSGHSTPGE